MKKKLLLATLSLMVIFVFGLTGCGGSDTDKETPEATTQQTEEQAEQPPEEQTDTATEEEDSSALKDILNDAKEEAKQEIKDQVTEEVKEGVSNVVGEVNPELKGFLDEYESFMNQYCDFMEQYNNIPYDDYTTAAAMLNDYTRLVQEMQSWTDRLNAYDPSIMSPADLAYYELVTGRVQERLNSVS